MKKALLVCALLVCLVGTAFAESAKSGKGSSESEGLNTWAKSYNHDGQLNIYGSAGYWLGFDVSAGAEIIFGELNIVGFPIDYGFMARGIFESYTSFGYSTYWWGAAPMFSVHIGMKDFPIEWYSAVGLGIYGYGGDYYSYYVNPGISFGFASFDGMMWHFSDAMALIVEYGYIGWASVWGIGVELKL
jgi:hypothetical protein